MKYKREEQTIVREKDGKVVANIDGDEITPTAPVYYKFMDEFKRLCEPEVVVTPTLEKVSDIADEQPTPEEVGEQIEAANAVTDDDPEPPKTARQGTKTPGYPSWVFRNDPALAKKYYEGKNVQEYENLIK